MQERFRKMVEHISLKRFVKFEDFVASVFMNALLNKKLFNHVSKRKYYHTKKVLSNKNKRLENSEVNAINKLSCWYCKPIIDDCGKLEGMKQEKKLKLLRQLKLICSCL